MKILNLSQACIDFRDTPFSFRSELTTTPLHGAHRTCRAAAAHHLASSEDAVAVTPSDKDVYRPDA
jgi:hypothetical protein